MGNMSYCRFENTAYDLRDCLDAIQNRETEDLSTYEVEGLEKILDLAHRIVEETEFIENILKEYEY